MKKSNKQIILDLCKYYKSEKDCPYPEEIKANYWYAEKQFFDNPNSFQLKNIEEAFKASVLDYLVHVSDSLMKPSEIIINDYFERSPS